MLPCKTFYILTLKCGFTVDFKDLGPNLPTCLLPGPWGSLLLRQLPWLRLLCAGRQ